MPISSNLKKLTKLTLTPLLLSLSFSLSSLLFSLLLTSCSLPGGGNNVSQDTSLSPKPLIPIISWSTVILDYRFYSSGEVVEEGSWATLHVGKWEKFPMFDTELLGMKAWDKKSVLLHASVAYGTKDQEQIVRRSQITRSDTPGMESLFWKEDIATGATTKWNNQTLTIKQILDDEFIVITYPRQHPLAGKSLTFEVEVKSVE